MFLKQRLQSTDVLRGIMTLIPSAVVTQAVAAAGADFVLIDREHGPIGRETMHAMIAATAGTGCAALVRVPSIDETETKAALDAGAEGIVFPLVRTAADAERCVSYLTYPPAGLRSSRTRGTKRRCSTTRGALVARSRVACCWRPSRQWRTSTRSCASRASTS